MQVNKITFTSENTSTSSSRDKKDYLAMFYTKAKNSADMTDTILVPRTIFKGYLGIMAGTTLVTLGSLIRFKKAESFSKALSISGLIASLYGTYSFVRPYIFKSKGVDTAETVKNKQNSDK